MAGSTTWTAERIGAALADRTWGFDGASRCHVFLLLAGRSSLAASGRTAADVATDVASPAMLWLPHPARGSLRIMAGGEGFGASLSPDLAQRIAGEAALNAYLRPLLPRMVLAGPALVEPRFAQLSATFAALVDESRGQEPAAEAMGVLHLSALLLHLWRCAGARQQAGSRGGGATTVQRFRQLVELHYREGLPIDAFAGRLGVSRAHLHEACRRGTGLTPLGLLHQRLLAEARSRLEQTDLSVEQVGYGIGFRDPGYFNRFFKRLSGQSPGAYRRLAAAARRTDATPSFAAWP